MKEDIMLEKLGQDNLLFLRAVEEIKDKVYKLVNV